MVLAVGPVEGVVVAGSDFLSFLVTTTTTAMITAIRIKSTTIAMIMMSKRLFDLPRKGKQSILKSILYFYNDIFYSRPADSLSYK